MIEMYINGVVVNILDKYLIIKNIYSNLKYNKFNTLNFNMFF